MKISPISKPLERPSLEEIKKKAIEEMASSARGGLIWDEGYYYGFWAKLKARGVNDADQ